MYFDFNSRSKSFASSQVGAADRLPLCGDPGNQGTGLLEVRDFGVDESEDFG